MGDRALVIFHDSSEVSPVAYLHWGGEAVPELLKKHAALMADRKGDVAYSAARFIGIAHTESPGNLSLGIWNVPEKIANAVLCDDGAALAEYSHGDAGVIVVNADTFEWKAYGGYLTKYDKETGVINWEAA